MKPTLSLGLPVYNGLPYLQGAIESLLAQTFVNFELVISDNASQDASAELCRRLAARDARIRFIQQEDNVGAAENFNRVFHETRGEYFKWATADDCCLPDYLEKCIRVLKEQPDVALCYPKTYLTDETGGPRREYEDRLDLNDPSPYSRFDQFLRRIDLANAVFGIFRREVLAQTQLIGSYPSSDLVLLAEVALRGRIHEVPDRLFLRRIHPKQSMQAYKSRQDRAAWFRPNQPLGRYFPCWRTLLEFGKAVRSAPLTRQAKFGCYLSLRHWPRRYGKDHWRDLRRGVVRLVKSTWPNPQPPEPSETTLSSEVSARQVA